MTSGSRDSTRFVRPRYLVVPRGGLLLILLGGALAVAFGCSEQPLVAVERRAPTATGGSSSSHSSGSDGGTDEPGAGGKSNPSGGWFGTGGSGEDGGAPECKSDGQLCDDNSDCCGGSLCNEFNRRCTQLPKCIPVAKWEPCETNLDCCSGKCEQGDCKAIEGCKPIGELFSFAWECCSGAYAKNACLANGLCKAVGETCGESAWDKEPKCCLGAICSPTTEGVWRCNPENCSTESNKCSVASDCCMSDAHCIKRKTMPSISEHWPVYGTCQACQGAGDACSVDFDCCSDDGLICREGKCTQRLCTPIGEDCSSWESGGNNSGALNCCNGLACDTKTFKCVQKQP